MKQTLTIKQRVFVGEYLIDFNATAAAKRSGHSEKTAARIAVELLNKPHVSKAVQLAIKKREAMTERSALDVLKDISETAREARQAGNYSAALKGYELEGKHYGLFERPAPGKDENENGLIRSILDALKG